MQIIKYIGLVLFIFALLLFLLVNGLDHYQLKADIPIDNAYHRAAILDAAAQKGVLEKEYPTSFAYYHALQEVMTAAKNTLATQAKAGLPKGVKEWDYRLGDWKIKEYYLPLIQAAATGPVTKHPVLFLFLTFGLGILGGLLYILPSLATLPGIRNNHIYQRSLTRGLTISVRTAMLLLTIAACLAYGYTYMSDNWVWPSITLVVGLLIIWRVLRAPKPGSQQGSRSASPSFTGWLGVLAGVLLIGFYVLLYWAPQHITAWMRIANPVSRLLSGQEASHWFVYGLLYTITVLVMGVRMLVKYRHNRYQIIRTLSVMFFQTAFAFLLPEILVRLNQPYYDFKNIWPLNYTFFFDYNIKSLVASGGIGIFMLVWGIVLMAIGVPVFTYFFGKRWYCSWVCGCGGLAETVGDPWRQLSDKSLRAWQYERWIIHTVLVFAVVMTALVLYTYFTGSKEILFLHSDQVRTWYGFLIGSAFAGIVGTGFYPLMGNRTWCRFGCPLAAYLGLVQRFKSRFRITVNGGQCISCGNCSTYCEMGIDVRHYAQRGQDVVRASCVGCGVCAAVCPRGVLRLENGTSDVHQRAAEVRVLRIKEGGVTIDGYFDS
ncbi:MAG: 4Fe-4S binding protein [Saprospiraceae bacterium]